MSSANMATTHWRMKRRARTRSSPRKTSELKAWATSLAASRVTCDPVMAEEGLEGAREQEVQRGVAGGQIGDGHAVNRLLELGVEVVNPELVEVAEDDVGRAVGDEVEPVVEGLLVVLGELDAAGLHFDEAAARPDEVGVLGALAGEADAVFEGGAFGQGVGVVAEGGEQVKEEGLGFALFVALELGGELGEVAQVKEESLGFALLVALQFGGKLGELPQTFFQ